MKKLISISVIILTIAALSGINAGNPTKNKSVAVSNSVKVEVFYFHFTRRCVTCQAVETETKNAIASLYPAELKSGKITFRSLNLDEKENLAMAEKCKADGQSLLIISGNNRIDLTDTGFMYAKSKPEKLKSELKKTIDSLLK